MSVMKMAGDNQLSLCYFKNRIIRVTANELEECAKKLRRDCKKGLTPTDFSSTEAIYHISYLLFITKI